MMIPSLHRFHVFITAIILLMSSFCFGTAFAQNSKDDTAGSSQNNESICDRCKQPLLGGYIKADGYKFHQECFLCSKCGKPITGSFQHKDGDFYHSDCYKEKMGLVCARCGKLLDQKWQVLDDRKFHAECLKQHLQEIHMICDICKKPITGKYTKDQSKNYHIDCLRNYKLTRCAVCEKPIEGRMLIDPWGNKAHEKHEDHQTVTCSSCMRIISSITSKGGFRYSDGRTICGICKPTVVEKNNVIMKSRNTVLSLLYSIGITDIPVNIPINIVDMENLKKYSKSSPTSDSKGFTSCLTTYKNNQAISKSQAIYILNGLPLLEFNGVLAHEIMHVWLNERDIKLTAPETEGFCNLGTMKVYQDDGTEFAKILLENMEKDQDPIYGDGYQNMKKQLEAVGWGKLIQMIQNR